LDRIELFFSPKECNFIDVERRSILERIERSSFVISFPGTSLSMLGRTASTLTPAEFTSKAYVLCMIG
jgi:hypothetical protein